MRIRGVAAAALMGVAALILSACSSSVDGQPQRDEVAAATGGLVGGLSGDDLGGLGDGSGDLGDLEDLFGGMDGSGDLEGLEDLFGDLDGLFGGMDGSGDLEGLEGLGDLFGGMDGSGDVGDLSGLFGGMGGLLAGMAGPECGPAISISMAVAEISLYALMSDGAVSQERVDNAFSQLDDLPDELKPAAQQMYDALSSAVGSSGAELLTYLDSPAFEEASEVLDDYIDEHCDL